MRDPVLSFLTFIHFVISNIAHILYSSSGASVSMQSNTPLSILHSLEITLPYESLHRSPLFPVWLHFLFSCKHLKVYKWIKSIQDLSPNPIGAAWNVNIPKIQSPSSFINLMGGDIL